MRYCPVCWAHKMLSRAYAEIRYWWLYKVLKRPEPDVKEVMMKLVPSLITAMIGLRVVDEVVRSLDDEYKKQRETDEKELRDEIKHGC